MNHWNNMFFPLPKDFIFLLEQLYLFFILNVFLFKHMKVLHKHFVLFPNSISFPLQVLQLTSLHCHHLALFKVLLTWAVTRPIAILYSMSMGGPCRWVAYESRPKNIVRCWFKPVDFFMRRLSYLGSKHLAKYNKWGIWLKVDKLYWHRCFFNIFPLFSKDILCPWFKTICNIGYIVRRVCLALKFN